MPAGRPRKYGEPTERLIVRLPEGLHSQLRAVRAATGTSVAEQLVNAARDALRAQEAETVTTDQDSNHDHRVIHLNISADDASTIEFALREYAAELRHKADRASEGNEREGRAPEDADTQRLRQDAAAAEDLAATVDRAWLHA